MNEKQKDTNSSAQQKLKEETTQLLSVVEETEKELEKSYRILAEEPKENGENAPLDQKIQKEIDSLKEVNNDLKQAHQRTMAMEDELSARFRDMQKSRDRKWYRLNPPAKPVAVKGTKIGTLGTTKNHLSHLLDLLKNIAQLCRRSGRIHLVHPAPWLSGKPGGIGVRTV